MFQYDLLAPRYELFVSENALKRVYSFTGEITHPFYEEYQPQAILDCACGIGNAVIALKKGGHDVIGSDGSKGMLEQARKRASQEGLQIEFIQCDWRNLAETFEPQFDLVMCRGNSICHMPTLEDVTNAFHNMWSVLKPYGICWIDTRNFDKVLKEREKYSLFRNRIREADDESVIILYVWDYSGLEIDNSITVDVIMIFQKEDNLRQEVYPVKMYPILQKDLEACVKNAGFTHYDCDASEDRGSYNILAYKMP